MKLTREGKRFLLAAALIAVAAINTGNNLIYLILSLMLSFIVLSYLILRLNLAKLVLEVAITGPVFAGEQVSVELLIHNKKKFPVYSVIIAAPDAVAQVYCEQISGHGLFRDRMKMVFRKRGLYGYRDFTIQSGFPFILFRKSMPVAVSGKILVYPKLRDVRDMIVRIEGRQAEGAAVVRGSGDEVYSLRAFQYGDDWRRIHWKASARQDGFLIRKYAEYASQNITVLLDNLLPDQQEHFETVVSIAASIIMHYLDQGCLVRLVAAGRTVRFGSGYEHSLLILETLALLDQQPQDALPSGYVKEGCTIAVLKSARSALKAAVAPTDMVIYADSL